jgi:hypothetical protein
VGVLSRELFEQGEGAYWQAAHDLVAGDAAGLPPIPQLAKNEALEMLTEHSSMRRAWSFTGLFAQMRFLIHDCVKGASGNAGQPLARTHSTFRRHRQLGPKTDHPPKSRARSPRTSFVQLTSTRAPGACLLHTP